MIISILLIKIFILIFFYNEFFNEGKLKEIERQLENAKKVKTFTDESKKELFVAYSYLQSYIDKPNKASLELYFNSLITVVSKMESAKIYVNSMMMDNDVDSIKIKHGELEDLGKLIDSTYTNSPQFPDGNSLSIIPEIKKIQPDIKVLIFTSFKEEHYSLKFIEAGANDFLSKLSEEHVIRSAITNMVEKGEHYLVLTRKLLEITQYSAHFSNPIY